MQYIQLQSQDPNSLNNPLAGSFNIFIDETDNTLKVKDQAGEVYGGGGGGFSNITYSGLVNSITTSGLTAGGFYLITDFRTCYDQPDFDSDGQAITTGATKQSAVEPIMVFATSESTISTNAYQPLYPNDRIQYDWTFSATEVTNSVAYGRITERIDEFNNRTDYDHRTILFKRYRLYTHRQDQRLNGTIELFSNGIVSGTSTSFTALTVGDVIYVPNVDPSFYEITGITNNLTMRVSGDTISTDGSGLQFYKAIDENNGEGGYFSYKRTNVKTNDFIEYTTFGDAISENYAKNNYIGNYANNYTEISNGTFILANNVFIQGPYESNTYGDSCYDNTFGTDNQNNTWGNHCYRNVSTNNIYDNIIGHYFYQNLINDNLQRNHIGNNFDNNRLLAENEEDFADNIIGNYFNNNTIYSRFYGNEILNEFNSNTIGDFGNLTNFEFYNNVIGNSFGSNTIRQDFNSNVIGGEFTSNVVNGDFYNSVIGNSFNNNNNIGYAFNNNHIGNNFSGNQLIGDDFRDNKIGDDFDNNKISYDFYENQINNNFNQNDLGDSQYFNWNDTSIENLTGRTYDTFYESLDGNIGDVILGKELIMYDTNNDEYHRVKFTQWTQNANGGGFQYERTKVYPTQEDTVYFTKTNNGSEVDIIVEGSLEITRDNNGGIYNQADENDWNENESPVGTEWNSIYTQSNNGRNFYRNNISNNFENNSNIGYNFRNNQIGNDFNNNNNTGNNFQNNQIGNLFNGNNIYSGFYDNLIAKNFNNNEIYSDFYKNEILIDFNNNTIGNSVDLGDFNFYRNYIRNNFNDNIIRQEFQNNQIGTNFQENTINGEFINNTILNGYNENTIGNYFSANNIGNGFNNNTVYENFNENTIGNYFGNNLISNDFYNNNIGSSFDSNEPSNSNLFGWDNLSIGNNLSTVSTRTYDTLRISLNNAVGNYIIGQELVMRVISTSQYFKFKFTQWTQNGNGGGFQYERQELDSSGNTIGSLITFIKTNYGSEVDVIVEGVVELTRDSEGGLYNTITDTPPFNNNWPGPGDTEWNSIYTQENNGERFTYNKIGNQFSDNTIGSYFGYDNDNAGDSNGNKIGDDFRDNNVVSTMYGNVIGNNFNNNDIYSKFYNNQIGNNFEINTITDFGNLENFQFYNNVIGNDFIENIIRQNFNDNKIGNDFDSNVVNGNFIQNFIGNLFQSNPNIGLNFSNNHIGNNFNSNNVIGDYFTGNTIGEYFESNINISYDFQNNQIGNIFENNTLGNTDNFNWDNTSIENLTGRTYDTFYQSLNESIENVDNVILGKELIMRFSRNSGTTITSGDLVVGETYEITNYQGDDDFSNVADVISGDINTNGCIFIATETTPTEWSSNSELTELTSYDEYHKVKFTQWTQNNNGGGFSYERTKVYPTVESTVSFTKTNSVSNVDIIVEGRLEITRDNDGAAIYNTADEGDWNSDQSPVGTEWNSIYTQPFNGSEFGYNTIFGDFKGNYIRGEFAGNKIDSDVGGNEFSGNTYLNNIGIATYDNDFLGGVYGNNWVGPFYLNVIGDSFESNSFETNIGNNTIANNFQSNQIGNNFEDNTIGEDFFSNNIQNYFYENTIGDGFQTNQIGSYFNNNTIADYFGYGYGAPQGNKIGSNFYNNTVGEYFYNNTIPDNFTENTIGNYFQWNIVNTSIDSTDFTPNYGNITGFTYTATGTSATDDIYTGLSGVTTSEFGVNATFDIEVSGGAVIGVSGNTEGKLYVTGDTITILGSQIAGGVPDDDIVITVSGVTIPSVYGTYTCQLFERQGGAKRLSFYDGNDILTITNINE